MGFVEHDHAIHTLAPDQANQSFNVGLLPWGAVGDDNFVDAQMFDPLAEVHAVDAVTVAKQKTRCFVIRKRLDNLLACPTGSRVDRDVEMSDAAPVWFLKMSSRRNPTRRVAHSRGRSSPTTASVGETLSVLACRSPDLRWLRVQQPWIANRSETVQAFKPRGDSDDAIRRPSESNTLCRV